MMGAVFGSGFIYTVSQLAASQRKAVRFHDNTHALQGWMIFIVMFLLTFSLLFAYSGKVKTTKITADLVEQSKTTIFCRSEKKQAFVGEMITLICRKKGFKGVTFQPWIF